jgi:hypothetical protein
MVSRAATIATLLYLLPYAVVLFARARADRRAWDVALDLPFTAALDLLVILLLSRVVTLESAALASRPLWLVGGALYVAVRRRREGRFPSWPRALGVREVAVAAVAALLAGYLSMELSRQCHNADRAWHIPLVTSLRGQTIPFVNVYEPHRALAYHFTGDVLAATLQTLSGGVIHSSLALSLAHDLTFALTGASLALLFVALGVPRLTYAWLATLAYLLAGPLTLLRQANDRLDGGYNFINYLKLSYRPHVCLSGLLIVGFLGVLAVHLRERGAAPSRRQTLPVLFAVTALLAVTDEASIGMLGLALGVTWLVVPEILHDKRLAGLLVLVGLLAAVILPNVVFVAALAPGQPPHELDLVPARSPGYFHPILLLTTKAGRDALRFDLYPSILLLVATAIALVRGLCRERLALLLFGSALFAFSVVALTRLDVDGLAVENHRFMTAALLSLPVLTVLALLPGGDTRFPLPAAGPVARSLAIAALGLSAVSTLEWVRVMAPSRCTKPSRYSSSADFFQVDCREEVGAAFGQKPSVHHLEETSWYHYAGCRPVFASGPKAAHWQLKIGLASFGRGAFRDVNKNLAPAGEPLTLVCPLAKPKKPDLACEAAEAAGTCAPAGTKLRLCTLPADQRDAVDRRWAPVPKGLPAPKTAKPDPEPEDEPSATGDAGAEPPGAE